MDLITQDLPCLSSFKLLHYEARAVGKQEVGIRLKCLLVSSFDKCFFSNIMVVLWRTFASFDCFLFLLNCFTVSVLKGKLKKLSTIYVSITAVESSSRFCSTRKPK